MKHITILLLFYSTTLLAISDQTIAQNVPYTVGKNYFVKNTIMDGEMIFPKITNKEMFDEIFGAAAVMGKDGSPTLINFSSHFVIAVVDSKSDKKVTLEPLELTKQKNKISFVYNKSVGDSTSSFISRNCIILIVDKKFEGDVKIEKISKEELIPYVKAKRYFVKNNVSEGIKEIPVISTSDVFEEYFAMAPVMGEAGIPTPIDFSKQFVIAIINESTTDLPEILIRNLSKREGNISLNYTVDNSNPGTSFRNCVLLLVDNKYRGNVSISRTN